MAKFSFKRPRIISKRFDGMDSTIDGVTKSLHDLVFSYTERVDKSLQKKHVMMALSSLVLLIVLGSFISPKGKAESSIFYPDTCLGGWVNPQYAQGEQQTTSNGDESQFTKDNSAVLPKNTNAEMYCGNFKGKFDSGTLPTKIIVSLALTKGVDLLPEDVIESGLVATTSSETGSTTLPNTPELIIASSSSSSTIETTPTTESTTTEASSTNVSSTTQEEATSTPVISPQESPSVIDGIIESVKDTINVLFDTQTKDQTGTTDTVVVPPPPPEEPPQTEPTSRIPSLYDNTVALVFGKVFAQEDTANNTVNNAGNDESTTSEVLPSIASPTSSSSASLETPKGETPPDSILPENQPPEATTFIEALTNMNLASSTESTSTVEGSTTPEVYATTSEQIIATTTDVITASTTDNNQFQNNFLEVLYTFDGVTWVSLGELNEISMKYRTFEIPVTASTSWNDMSKLQIKVVAKKHEQDTPTVYLDAIKVEVLYNSTLLHTHPDFARDTILKDEMIDDMRIVTIINNETNQEEIWYMYLDDASSTVETASSTELIATSTPMSSSTLREVQTLDGTSTLLEATTTGTTTPSIKPVRIKNVWMKFNGTRQEGATGEELRQLIIEEDTSDTKEEEKQELPDFTRDIIEKIKGTFLNTVLIQLKKHNQEALWLYDVEKGSQEKLSDSSSTSLAPGSPLGVKGEYVFWISKDGTHVFAYNMVTKDIQEQTIPEYDSAKGERGEVTFGNIPWKVIISTDGFLFWSEQTGEVFSDDNGSAAETLRHTLELDKALSKDDLSNLNFQVEKEEDTSH